MTARGLVVQNGRWIDPSGKLCDQALVVRDGRLRVGVTAAPGDRVLDAGGGLILPGAVDAHTHLREPGQEHKEGIDNGTRAALAGGVTTVLDMPNNAPPVTSAAGLAAKAGLFRAKSRVNWGLHVQAPVEDPRALGPHAAAKLYLARSSSLPAVEGLEAVSAVLRAHRRVAVHAEDESRFLPAARFGPRSHHLQRPREAVASALALLEEALLGVPVEERPRLILCHASTAEEVAWLRRMKAAGHDVWGETCPHYLLLDEQDYLREGARLKVNPPLRTPADVAAVRAGLADGALDFVSTDHAPHSPLEKSDEAGAPSGIPGLEWLYPALLSLVDAGALTLERLVQVAAGNAARCYALERRGRIEEGAWADLAVVAKGRPAGGEAAAPPVVTLAGYAPPYAAGLEWRVAAVVVSGRLACQDGVFFERLHGREVVS